MSGCARLCGVKHGKERTAEMFFKLEKERQEKKRRARRARMVPEEGLEPSRTFVRQILSLLRLPLRHSGKNWSGRWESNPRGQLGRLELCH